MEGACSLIFFFFFTLIRKAVIEDCLPDQLRVDHGREFYLSLFVQESIADLRTNTERDPHRRTESKKVTAPLFKIWYFNDSNLHDCCLLCFKEQCSKTPGKSLSLPV